MTFEKPRLYSVFIGKDPNILFLANGLPADLRTDSGQIGAIRLDIRNIEKIQNPTIKAKMEYVRIWTLRFALRYLVDFAEFKIWEWNKDVLKNDREKSRLSISLSGHLRAPNRFDHVPLILDKKIDPEDVADVLCEFLNKLGVGFKIRRPCQGDYSYYFIITADSPITDSHVSNLILMHKKKYPFIHG